MLEGVGCGKVSSLVEAKKSVINRGTDFGKEERWGQRKRARRLQVLEHTNDAADASGGGGGGGGGGGAYEGVEETKSELPIRQRELPDLRKFAVSPSQYFEQQRQQWRKKQSFAVPEKSRWTAGAPSIGPPLQQLLLRHLVLAQALQWQEHRRAAAEAAWRDRKMRRKKKRDQHRRDRRAGGGGKKGYVPGGGDGTRFVDGHPKKPQPQQRRLKLEAVQGDRRRSAASPSLTYQARPRRFGSSGVGGNLRSDRSRDNGIGGGGGVRSVADDSLSNKITVFEKRAGMKHQLDLGSSNRSFEGTATHHDYSHFIFLSDSTAWLAPQRWIRLPRGGVSALAAAVVPRVNLELILARLTKTAEAKAKAEAEAEAASSIRRGARRRYDPPVVAVDASCGATSNDGALVANYRAAVQLYGAPTTLPNLARSRGGTDRIVVEGAAQSAMDGASKNTTNRYEGGGGGGGRRRGRRGGGGGNAARTGLPREKSDEFQKNWLHAREARQHGGGSRVMMEKKGGLGQSKSFAFDQSDESNGQQDPSLAFPTTSKTPRRTSMTTATTAAASIAVITTGRNLPTTAASPDDSTYNFFWGVSRGRGLIEAAETAGISLGCGAIVTFSALLNTKWPRKSKERSRKQRSWTTRRNDGGGGGGGSSGGVGGREGQVERGEKTSAKQTSKSYERTRTKSSKQHC